MEVILITKSTVGHKRAHFGALACTAFLVAVGLLAGGAYLLGTHQVPPPKIVEAPRGIATAEFRELQRQRKLIDDAIVEADADVESLSQRLGILQANVTRLNALGERVVTMNLLDPKEFDFKRAPAQGGPAPLADSERLHSGDLRASMRELSEELEDREAKLHALEELLMQRFLDARVFPSGAPVSEGWMSSKFGMRRDPISGRRAMHEGVDYAGAAGTEIRAVASGVVTHSGKMQGYGNMVEIAHGDGYTTRYAHNSENIAEVGRTVRRGETIALMGSTGRSTGAHVHFEVRKDGEAIDPAPFIASAQ